MTADGSAQVVHEARVGGPLRFAHRGAPVAPAGGNSLAAFRAALNRGAGGLESDVRLTADGVPVLVHGRGRVGGRSLRTLRREELPAHVAALGDVWERLGSGFDLALDMADPDAADAVVALARRYGTERRLWLTYWHLPRMALWRRRWPEVKLLYATMLARPELLLHRTAARVAAAGVDAINVHHWALTARSSRIVHAHGLQLFAWGLRDAAAAARPALRGVDAVFLDDLR